MKSAKCVIDHDLKIDLRISNVFRILIFPFFRYIPSCLRFKKRVKGVACGSEHNLAMIEGPGDGISLFTWGWNEHGNCGDGTTTNALCPAKIQVPGNLQVIGAGSGHSFALVKLF